MVDLPLTGIRILELTLVWAGPYCGQILADWGAEVIRLESTQWWAPATRGAMPRPSREIMEWSLKMGYGYVGKYPTERTWNNNPLFNTHARNKMSMTVDMRRPEGIDICKELIKVSDVFIENNVPQNIEKLGMAYDDLKEVRPDLIMVRMPAYGLEGTYKNYRSWGMHVEGVAGHSWVKGYEGSPLADRPEVNASDAAAGLSAALSTLIALRHRRRTGEGQLIEVPLCENFIPYLGEHIMDYTMNGRLQGAIGNRHPSRAPHGCYPCKGKDKWIVLAVSSDHDWEGMKRAMECPVWAEDPRFATVLGRYRHQQLLDFYIVGWTAGLEAYEVMRRLQDEGVSAGPVLNERDAHADPHVRERGFFQELHDPECDTHQHVGLMWKMSNTPNKLRTHPCHLGEHNPYVYKEILGISNEEYRHLEEEGHIGDEFVSHVV